LRSLTDEAVRRWGYANKEMYLKEYMLGQMASRWRHTQDPADVESYHLLFHELVAMGWDPQSLDVEYQLPVELMPKIDTR
jgi:hypothetical protein